VEHDGGLANPMAALFIMSIVSLRMIADPDGFAWNVARNSSFETAEGY
jgi:hypothetical protein